MKNHRQGKWFLARGTTDGPNPEGSSLLSHQVVKPEREEAAFQEGENRPVAEEAGNVNQQILLKIKGFCWVSLNEPDILADTLASCSLKPKFEPPP